MKSSYQSERPHQQLEIHHATDFPVAATHLPLNCQALLPVFDLYRAEANIPLKRCLLRASLLIDGVLASDLVSRRLPLESLHHNGREWEHMRIEFSTDYIPLAYLNSVVTLRLVTNCKLGRLYEVRAWAFPCLAPQEGRVDIKFCDKSEASCFTINENQRLVYRGPELGEFVWRPIGTGPPTFQQQKRQTPPPATDRRKRQAVSVDDLQHAARQVAPPPVLHPTSLDQIRSLLASHLAQAPAPAPYSPTAPRLE